MVQVTPQSQQRHVILLESDVNCSADLGRHCAPGNDRAINEDGSKGCKGRKLSCLNLLHILQLISHSTAVTTAASIAPGHHGAIRKDSRKGIVGCLNLLHVFQLISHSTAITTAESTAQVTTRPSRRIAAKARDLA